MGTLNTLGCVPWGGTSWYTGDATKPRLLLEGESATDSVWNITPEGTLGPQLGQISGRFSRGRRRLRVGNRRWIPQGWMCSGPGR